MGPAGRATHERLGDAVIMTHEADSFVLHGEMSHLRVENNIKRTLEVREEKNGGLKPMAMSHKMQLNTLKFR